MIVVVFVDGVVVFVIVEVAFSDLIVAVVGSLVVPFVVGSVVVAVVVGSVGSVEKSYRSAYQPPLATGPDAPHIELFHCWF